VSKLKPKIRKQLIIDAAMRVARRPGGWSSLTRNSIAVEADCCDALISRYLGSMKDVRRVVMHLAIKTEQLDLIAQGIACGYPACLSLSPRLRYKALVDLGE
jgi:hypothetical protein